MFQKFTLEKQGVSKEVLLDYNRKIFNCLIDMNQRRKFKLGL
jgi:hypothetical protein